MVFWSPRGRPTSPPLVSTYLSSLLSTLPSPCLTRPLSASGEAVKRPRCANDLHRAPICSAPIDAGIAGPAANRQPLAAGTSWSAAEPTHSPSNRRAPGAPSTAIDGPINRCRPPQPTPPSLTRGSPPALRLGIPLPRKAPRNAADRRGNAHFWVVRVTIRSRHGPQSEVPQLDAGIAGPATGRQPLAAGTSGSAAESPHSTSNRQALGAPSVVIGGPIERCSALQTHLTRLTRGSPSHPPAGIPLPRKTPWNAAESREWCSP